MQQLEQARQGDLMGLSGGGVKPVGEAQEAAEGIGIQQQGQGMGVAPGVGHHVPVAGEARQTLHGGEVEVAVGEQGIGRLWVVAHGELHAVARDGGAAQALQ
mgnify:CR=1 FL=1